MIPTVSYSHTVGVSEACAGGTLIPDAAKGIAKLTNETHLRKDRGERLGPVPSGFAGHTTSSCSGSFSADRHKRYPTTRDGSIASSADAGMRRVSNRCDTTMTKTVDRDRGDRGRGAQKQERPVSADCRDRFDGFDTSISQVSNSKTGDGGGELTRLTDLTVLERGVYVAPARAHSPPRPPARPANTYTPFNCRQIRQIRQTARRRGREIGVLNPPGVKPVKSTPSTDSGVTL